MKKIFALILACLMLAGSLALGGFAAHDCYFSAMRNAEVHWEECLTCGEIKNVETHSIENGKCTVCEWKETAEHTHAYAKMRNADAHWEECLVCNEVVNASAHVLSDTVCEVCHYDTTTGHTHNYTVIRNDASHWEECLECGAARNASAHEFFAGACTVCGLEDENYVPEIDSHDHRYVYEKTFEGHWKRCRVCRETNSHGEHEFENEKCVDCGMLEPRNPFRDVSDGDWFCTDVIRAWCFGLVNGKNAADTFLPHDYMTYAEAIKLAACMNELYEKGDVTLKNGNPWYQSYVDYCREHEIISKDYNYSALATREGYMEIFAKALPDSALETLNEIPENFVPDVPSDSEYAEPIYKLYRAGILAGVDEKHNCNPKANIKRCEVAAIVSRMMDESQRLFFMKFVEEEPVEGKLNLAGGEIYGYIGSMYFKNPEVNIDSLLPLEIKTQPVKVQEAENYGDKLEVSVEAEEGVKPYSYQWYYYSRRDAVKLENNGWVTGVNSDAIYVNVTKDNPYVGVPLFCEVKDANGEIVKSTNACVYGPLSVEISTVSFVQGKGVLVAGTVLDGAVKTGDVIQVERDGEYIGSGTVKEISMFGKNLDMAVKGESAGFIIDFIMGEAAKYYVAKGDFIVRYTKPSEDVIN